MRSADYLRLPECVINEVPVYLSEKERSVYDTFRDDMVVKLKNVEIDALNAAVLSGKLLQMANGAVYGEDNRVHTHDRKLEPLEIYRGRERKTRFHCLLVSARLDRIEERLRGLHIPFAEMKASGTIEKWNSGEIPVALIHPASAGHGLNLQAGGSTLIWFGLTWSLELYQQTNARLWRQGQQNTVILHHIIAKDTIDEDVMKALNRKEKTQSALIDAVKANLEVTR
jgi:hypothetical protein